MLGWKTPPAQKVIIEVWDKFCSQNCVLRINLDYMAVDNVHVWLITEGSDH